jgi:excisionase family DNA binding protein
VSSDVRPEFYTVAEVTEKLGLGRLSVYRAIERGDTPFPVVRFGRRLLIPRAAFDRYAAGEDR